MTPMDEAWMILKRQTTLGEFHPDMPSPYGPVMYFHGTKQHRVPSIMREGLRAKDKNDWGDAFRGAFVTPSLSGAQYYGKLDVGTAKQPSSQPVLIGVRQGAGTPEPYFGFGDEHLGRTPNSYTAQRIFEDDWRFPKTVPPQFLVHLPPTDSEINDDEYQFSSIMPPFYVNDKPPSFEGETVNTFNMDEWRQKWGTQNTEGLE